MIDSIFEILAKIDWKKLVAHAGWILLAIIFLILIFVLWKPEYFFIAR